MALAIWIVHSFLYSEAPEEAYVAEYETKSNPPGQRAMIYLPDGSTLWLNAQSSIEYEKNFSDTVRSLRLVGEAFFMVKKNPEKPFIVYAGNTQITALGTSFNVEAYEGDDEVNVSLEQGLVMVRKQNQLEKSGVLLHPGDMAIVPSHGNEILVSSLDPISAFAWKDGDIIFKNAQFDEVIHKLERWYGVKFHYNEKPANNWRFTGTFHNEYLENILEAISFGERIDYEINGKYVQLKI
jgi:ferric-dicitrate binding protein FerR (iron transport regulator)